jgi:phosphotriesterase-related protein
MIRELGAFKAAGGSTIVDVTPVSLGRSPEALVEIAQGAGINVVMGGSYYTEPAHPPGIASRSVDDLAAEFVAEIRDGVGTTGVRPGIMGEIGTSDPITEAERKVLRAHAFAHLETGVAMTIHQAPWAMRGHEILDLLVQEGVPLSRVVLGHMMAIDEATYQRELLRRGAILSYDFLGSDHAIFMYGRPTPPGRYPPNDYDVIENVAALASEGFAGQLLISGDIGERIRLQKFGSWGYSHIPRHVIPLMRDVGMGNETVRRITEDNPRHLLTVTSSLTRSNGPHVGAEPTVPQKVLTEPGSHSDRPPS